MQTTRRCLVLPILGLLISVGSSARSPATETPVIAQDALFANTVGGLERTHASASTVPVGGQPFDKALQVIIRGTARETNETQLTIPNSVAVERGDVMLAKLWLRGKGPIQGTAARIELLFERSVSPWTKSVTFAASAPVDGTVWRRVAVPFQCAETYQPGDAMLSLRFALGPQTVEVGGLELVNYGKSASLDNLVDLAASEDSLGDVTVSIDKEHPRQTMLGLGGDFCQPRYGAVEPMDAVGKYVLSHLRVSHARIGLPLNHWAPEPGKYREDGQAKASMLALQEMTHRKIPTVVSVWEAAGWLLGGQAEQSGRELAPTRYGDCIEAIAQYLVMARDKYQSEPQYFSFNEPDYGVNFKFTPTTMANFIRQAGPRFAELGLKTKFLVGDTANATNFAGFARPLLEDKSISAYLGPIAFHCWDALSASDDAYTSIYALGKEFKKPVWCLEAGHDAGLWNAPNPWASWENGLRTALAYERTLRLSGASVMDYWTYQDNYPIVNKDTLAPYPVFNVIHQMETVFAPTTKVVLAKVSNESLSVLGTMGKGLRLLLVNPIGAGSAHINGLAANAKFEVRTSTKDSQEIASYATSDAKGKLTVEMPTRSVVTVMGPH